LKTAPPAADFPHLNTSCGVVKVQVAEIRCGNVTFIAAAQPLIEINRIISRSWEMPSSE
jgi:hypothetical protein